MSTSSLDIYPIIDTPSSDKGPRATLIERGFISLAAIANIPLVDFVVATQGHLSEVEVAQVHAVASAQADLLNNMLSQVMVNGANGFPAEIDGQDRMRGLPSLNADSCQYQDCQYALSPLGYLTDLLDCSKKHLKSNNAPITLQFLTAESNEAAMLAYSVGICIKYL